MAGSVQLREALTTYTAYCGRHLTAQQETYVLRRAVGMNPVAAARMAGYRDPQKAVEEMANNPAVEDAIIYMRETQRQTAIAAGAITFTKDDATALYLQAHAKSENATEEIRAVDSLVKLHGLASPEKREVVVTSKEQLAAMSDAELAALAGDEILLDPEDYAEVIDVED